MLISFSAELKSKPLQGIALINDVSFNNAEYDNNNAGNGFIVTHKNMNYAITAKHILMIVKTDKMTSVDFAGELKNWKMYDKNNTTDYLIVDQMLNADRKEQLNWQTLKNDWLVFSIKQNKTDNKPLSFRTTPLITGEQLFVVGWSYQDKEGPQRTYHYEFEKTTDGLHHLKQITGPQSLAGLSGSPVIDKNNQVIGVVSTGWQDEDTKITYIQASSASDIMDFIEKNINKK